WRGAPKNARTAYLKPGKMSRSVEPGVLLDIRGHQANELGGQGDDLLRLVPVLAQLFVDRLGQNPECLFPVRQARRSGGRGLGAWRSLSCSMSHQEPSSQKVAATF